MERIAMAMQDGGAGAGARHEGAARAARPHFVLPPNLYVGPPVGGTFWFQIFIQAPSLEIWCKTISGAEGGPGREMGWPVFGLPPSKKILSAVARPRERSEPPWPHLAIHAAEHEFPRLHGLPHTQPATEEAGRSMGQVLNCSEI